MKRLALALLLSGCSQLCPPPLSAPAPAEVVMPLSQELLERINFLLALP